MRKLAIICLLCVLMLSCRAPKTIIDTRYIHDTTYVSRVDYVTKYDSVYIKEKGDTLYIYKYKYIDRYKADTLYKYRIDTVCVTESHTEYIEKPLSRWQQTKQDAFGWLLLLLAASVGWIFRKPIIKLLTKLL